MYSRPSDVCRVVKPRRLDSSKRDFGSLLVVGGSDVYSGAPALAGMAALRTGTGIVFIAAPASVASTIRSYSPNLIVHSLPGDSIGPGNMDHLSQLLAAADAVVLGPGIGRRAEVHEAVPSIVEMVSRARKPLLIDADGIRNLADRKEILRDANAVLTPHAGEFKALSGTNPPTDLKSRVSVCREFAKVYSCVLLLKGHNTVISDGDRVKVNRTGNPGMAVAGMGDVLSGIIGTFLAQHSDPFSAAVAGAYVHGLAGDRARKEKGFHIVASDLVELLPDVLRPYDRENRN